MRIFITCTKLHVYAKKKKDFKNITHLILAWLVCRYSAGLDYIWDTLTIERKIGDKIV